VMHGDAWRLGIGALALGALLAWLLRGGPPREPEPEAAAMPEFAWPRPPPDPPKPTLSTISGTVRDRAGVAIAGAQVCAHARSHLLARDDRQRPRCVVSERDGHYRIPDLSAGPHRVHASAAHHVPSAPAIVTPPPGGPLAGIDITLVGGGVEVTGVVLDLSGGTIEGALVELEGGVATSGPDGEFRLWSAPGRRGAHAFADGYTDAYDGGTVPGHRFVLRLLPEAVLVGKVVRASDGAAIAGARVHAEGNHSADHGPAFTDAAGSFRLGGLRPGAYKASAVSDDAFGLAPEQAIVGLGETSAEIVITAHPAFTIRGQIVGPNGEPCTHGAVGLTRRGAVRGADVKAGPDGTIEARGLLPGAIDVTVRCAELVPATSYPALTIIDRDLVGVRWVLGSGQWIRGRVLDARGAPMAGIEVSAAAQPDPQRPQARRTWGHSEPSDERGHFEIGGLLPANFDLTLQSPHEPRALPLAPTRVTLPEGQDLDAVKIVLPATGELRGLVRDVQGHAVANVWVALHGPDRQRSVTAADGRFSFSHVVPGEQRVFAERDGLPLRAPGSHDDDPPGTRVEVRENATTTTELVVELATAAISGTVQDGDGAPVVDAFIEVVRESESAAATGSALRELQWRSPHNPPLSDHDGGFRVDGLTPGKYTLRAHRRGGGEAVREHVAVGSTVTLKLAEGARLAGVVTTRDRRAPDEFMVFLREATTGASSYDRFYRTDGAWVLADLPPGRHQLRITTEDGSCEQTIDLAAGERRGELRMELVPFVTLRGRVLDLEGAPITGFAVMSPEQPPGAASDPFKRVTDTAGRYELAGLPAGRVHVMVMPPNSLQSEYGWTSVVADLDPTRAITELPAIRIAKPRVRPGAIAGDRGYTLRQTPPDLGPGERRLIVAVVRPGGPAAAAGLKIGDAIVRVDGHEVTGDHADLHDALLSAPPGISVTLDLARGASLMLTLGPPP